MDCLCECQIGLSLKGSHWRGPEVLELLLALGLLVLTRGGGGHEVVTLGLSLVPVDGGAQVLTLGPAVVGDAAHRDGAGVLTLAGGKSLQLLLVPVIATDDAVHRQAELLLGRKGLHLRQLHETGRDIHVGHYLSFFQVLMIRMSDGACVVQTRVALILRPGLPVLVLHGIAAVTVAEHRHSVLFHQFQMTSTDELTFLHELINRRKKRIRQLGHITTMLNILRVLTSKTNHVVLLSP